MTQARASTAVSGAETEVILAELVDQFIDRFNAGERIDASGFAAEHPAHASALLELLPAAATMATLRRSLQRSEVKHNRFQLDSDAIGGYRIVGEIGRGGMGVVYEAVQMATGRKVALKVLSITSATGPRQIERFRIEGRAAAVLRPSAYRARFRHRLRKRDSLPRNAIRRRVFAGSDASAGADG